MFINNSYCKLDPSQDSRVSNTFDLSGNWGKLYLGVGLLVGTVAIFSVVLFIKETYFNGEAQPTLEPVAPWKPRALAVDIAAQKMLINAKKAIEEHLKISTAYATLQEALSWVEERANQPPRTPLSFEHFSDEAQGRRDTMEDMHFVIENDQGLLTGVLDGHGGKEVADYASSVFQKNFFEILSNNHGNVHQIFEILCDEIHKQVAEKKAWDFIGTTAVICFIDKHTHQIYTATVGDSEANIYRKVKGQMKSIPLSCIRNWSSKRDAIRAAIALENPRIAITWPKESNSKYLRFPGNGVNVSRAFGDAGYAVSNNPIIPKPKITMNQMKPGDTLILACDGLKDYIPENEIIDNLMQELSTNPANRLVNYALKKSHDNVTVVAVNIK